MPNRYQGFRVGVYVTIHVVSLVAVVPAVNSNNFFLLILRYTKH